MGCHIVMGNAVLPNHRHAGVWFANQGQFGVSAQFADQSYGQTIRCNAVKTHGGCATMLQIPKNWAGFRTGE